MASIFLGTNVKLLGEWWKPEWIPSIFNSEYAEQEAVHDKDDTAPNDNSNLLSFGIYDSWYL